MEDQQIKEAVETLISLGLTPEQYKSAYYKNNGLCIERIKCTYVDTDKCCFNCNHLDICKTSNKSCDNTLCEKYGKESTNES